MRYYTNEILYPYGYGLSYKSDEPVLEITTTTTATTNATSVSTDLNEVDSPKTGSTSHTLAFLALTLAVPAVFVCRKKK